MLFVKVRVAIISGRNAGDYPGFVVQNGFNNVRLNLENSHVRCGGAADIVKTPILDIQTNKGIQPILTAPETGNGSSAC